MNDIFLGTLFTSSNVVALSYPSQGKLSFNISVSSSSCPTLTHICDLYDILTRVLIEHNNIPGLRYMTNDQSVSHDAFSLSRDSIIAFRCFSLQNQPTKHAVKNIGCQLGIVLRFQVHGDVFVLPSISPAIKLYNRSQYTCSSYLFKYHSLTWLYSYYFPFQMGEIYEYRKLQVNFWDEDFGEI